jgi:hypothetical protein
MVAVEELPLVEYQVHSQRAVVVALLLGLYQVRVEMVELS